MQNVTLTLIDLGKHSFHVHCLDKSGKALLHKKFTRAKLLKFLAGMPAVPGFCIIWYSITPRNFVAGVGFRCFGGRAPPLYGALFIPDSCTTSQ